MRPPNSTSSLMQQEQQEEASAPIAAPSIQVADYRIARQIPNIRYSFADGQFSKWDQPFWKRSKLENSQFVFKTAKDAVQARRKKIVSDNDHLIMMALADAKAIHEYQLRRIMSPLSNSSVARRVELLVRWGLLEKRRFDIHKRIEDPTEKYPAILTLTDTGKDYIRLTEPDMHALGSSDFLNRSSKLPINLISTNEIRIQLMEEDALISWQDHAYLDQLGRVSCLVSFQFSSGLEFRMITERISSMAKVDTYLSKRIKEYRDLGRKGVPLLDTDFALLFVVPSNSSIADLISGYQIYQLREFYPYIWFISHESLFSEERFKDGLIQIGEDGLESLSLPIGRDL